MNPDSTITTSRGGRQTVNPFRSRSTIIVLITTFGFLSFAGMILKAGYFDAGFASAGVLFLTNIVTLAFHHQSKSKADDKNTD